MARLRDRVLAFDPGWARIKLGVMVLAIALAVIGVEWVFVGQTHALQIDIHGATLPPAQAAQVAFANHAAFVGACLTGVSAGLLSLVSLADPRPRQIFITLSVVCGLLMVGFTFGLGLGRHHDNVGLASIVVALVLSCYLRRFGLIGFAAGIALFIGLFSGRQSSTHEDLGDLGWIAAELDLGLVTALIVLAVIFRSRPDRALAGLARGYVARSRRVIELAEHHFEQPSQWRRERLHRALVKLKEVAVMLDSHLSKPDAVADGDSRRNLHHRLFQVELATTNMVRSTADLSELQLTDATRAVVLVMLRALSVGDFDRARVCASEVASAVPPAGADRSGRFARAVLDLIDALTA